MTRRSLLEVENLSVRFEVPAGMVHALDRVTLGVGPGESVGIVGESGSGKSVLLRTIMGMTEQRYVADGVVTFDGVQIGHLGVREARRIRGEQISMVFQNTASALNPVRRIGSQLIEILRVHRGLRGRAARAESVKLLKSVRIPDAEGRLRAYPHELSGGLRQRVCIALAIACSPRLLLADEPTTALDVTVQRQILDLLGELQRGQDMALVLVTHDLGVVASRTRKIFVMYGGRIVESGPTRDVLRTPRHPYTMALIGATPRLSLPPHTRLATLPGRPTSAVNPSPGCRLAPRCGRVQDRCRTVDPILTVTEDPVRAVACFNPVSRSTAADGEAAASVTTESESRRG